MKKIFYALLVLTLTLVSGAAWAVDYEVSFTDEIDDATKFNTAFGSSGNWSFSDVLTSEGSASAKTLKPNDTVTMTGTLTVADTTGLVLHIPKGVTVILEGDIRSGAASALTVAVAGGTATDTAIFTIAPTGSITASAEDAKALSVGASEIVTLNINGEVTASHATGEGIAIVNAGEGNVTVSGNAAAVTAAGADAAAVAISNTGTAGLVNVSGGAVKATGTAGKPIASTTGKVTVSGSGSVEATGSGDAISGGAPVDVTGGTVKSGTGSAINTAGAINVTGATTSVTSATIAGAVIEGSTGKITVGGGADVNASAANGNAIEVNGAGGLEVDGAGTKVRSAGGTGATIAGTSSGAIVIKNGTISSVAGDVITSDGALTLAGGKLIATDETKNVISSAVGTTLVTGTVEMNGILAKPLAVQATNGQLTVPAGKTLKSSADSVVITNNDKIVVGVGSTLDLTSSTAPSFALVNDDGVIDNYGELKAGTDKISNLGNGDTAAKISNYDGATTAGVPTTGGHNAPETVTSPSTGGGGCNAGFGMLAFALASMFVIKKK